MKEFMIATKIENGARAKCILCDFSIVAGQNIYLMTDHFFEYHKAWFERMVNAHWIKKEDFTKKFKPYYGSKNV